MATKLMKDLNGILSNLRNIQESVTEHSCRNNPSDSPENTQQVPTHIVSSSLCMRASDNNVFNNQLHLRIPESDNAASDNAANEHMELHRSATSVIVSNRGTSPFNLPGVNLYYLMAVLVPFLSNHNGELSTPSNILQNTFTIFSRNIAMVLHQAQRNIHRFAEEQITRDVFATVMDVVLTIYAIGFIVLSLYQASVFA